VKSKLRRRHVRRATICLRRANWQTQKLQGDPSLLWKLRQQVVESDIQLRKLGGVSAVEYIDEDTLMKPSTISHRPGDNPESMLDAPSSLASELESGLGTDQVDPPDTRPQLSQDTAPPVLRPLHVPPEGNYISWLGLWNRADLEESHSSLSLKPTIRVETEGQRLWRIYNERVVTTMNEAAVYRLTRRRYEPPFGRSLVLDIEMARSERQYKRRFRSNQDPKQTMAVLKRLGLCPAWFTRSSRRPMPSRLELEHPLPASPEVVGESTVKEQDALARSGTAPIHNSPAPEEPISTAPSPPVRPHDTALISRSLPTSTHARSDDHSTRELVHAAPVAHVAGEGSKAHSAAENVSRQLMRDLPASTTLAPSPSRHDPPTSTSTAPSPFRHPTDPAGPFPSNETSSAPVDHARPSPTPDAKPCGETRTTSLRPAKKIDRPPTLDSKLHGATPIASSSITDANIRLSAAEEALRSALNARESARDALESARQALVASEEQLEDARTLLAQAEAASHETQRGIGSRFIPRYGSSQGRDVGSPYSTTRHYPAVSAAAHHTPTWASPSHPSSTRHSPVSRSLPRGARTGQEVGEHPSAAFRRFDGKKPFSRDGVSHDASQTPSSPSHSALPPGAHGRASYRPPSLSSLHSRVNAQDSTWSHTGKLRTQANQQVPAISGTRKLHSLVSRIARFVPP
jgi:hypothetical protein